MPARRVSMPAGFKNEQYMHVIRHDGVICYGNMIVLFFYEGD